MAAALRGARVNVRGVRGNVRGVRGVRGNCVARLGGMRSHGGCVRAVARECEGREGEGRKEEKREEEQENDDDDVKMSERGRRKKISAALKGKRAWNKGRRWSPEMVERIRETSIAAMSRPEVREKLAKHAEYLARMAAEKARRKREKKEEMERLKQVREEERRRTMWAQKLESSAERFRIRKEGMTRRARSVKRTTFSCAFAETHTSRAARPAARALAAKVLSLVSEHGDRSGTRSELSAAHRRRISESIAKKWREDDTYRRKVTYGIRRRMRSNAAMRGDVDVLKELRARAEMIANARRLLRRAEEAVLALERRPNVPAETKARAKGKVDAIMHELREIRKDIVSAKERESVDAAIVEEMQRMKTELPEARNSDSGSLGNFRE